MQITITVEDIRSGRRCDTGCCPLGRALSRAGINHFGVTPFAVVIPEGETGAQSVPLPVEVSQWLLEYDGGLEVKPMSFDLWSPPIRRSTARAAKAVRKKASPLAGMEPALAACPA